MREFEIKKRHWEEAAEAKTAKNRAKRQKKKEKAKTKNTAGAGNEKGDKPTASGGQDSEDAPLKKRRLVNGEAMVFRKPGEESEDEQGDEGEAGPMPAESLQPVSDANELSAGDHAREMAEASKIVIHEED